MSFIKRIATSFLYFAVRNDSPFVAKIALFFLSNKITPDVRDHLLSQARSSAMKKILGIAGKQTKTKINTPEYYENYILQEVMQTSEMLTKSAEQHKAIVINAGTMATPLTATNVNQPEDYINSILQEGKKAIALAKTEAKQDVNITNSIRLAGNAMLTSYSSKKNSIIAYFNNKREASNHCAMNGMIGVSDLRHLTPLDKQYLFLYLLMAVSVGYTSAVSFDPINNQYQHLRSEQLSLLANNSVCELPIDTPESKLMIAYFVLLANTIVNTFGAIAMVSLYDGFYRLLNTSQNSGSTMKKTFG